MAHMNPLMLLLTHMTDVKVGLWRLRKNMTNPHKMAVMLGLTKWQLLTQIDELLFKLYPEVIEFTKEELELMLDELERRQGR